LLEAVPGEDAELEERARETAARDAIARLRAAGQWPPDKPLASAED
jgi:hypothetical protein